MPEFVPRKCSATGRIIGSKDHASVQFNIGHVNANGLYTNAYTPVALCGYVRENCFADASVNRYAPLSPPLGSASTALPA
jgi:small subunit ribosomal protein S21e